MEAAMNPVLFDTLSCADGHALGVATLNGEKSLNALTLPMIHALDAQLAAWAQDDRIACVLLRGTGEKAFCAGGDVRALRTSLLDHPHPCPHPAATQYFSAEYALDYRIHSYAKPLIVWGQGIVMGGGLGLLAGASHRILTQQSRIAMPEISIGLYPDVGASWFLPRLPGRLGLFLALTGAPLNAGDALQANLGDHLLAPDAWPDLLAALAAGHWPAEQRHATASACIRALESATVPPARLIQHFDTIRRLMHQGELKQVLQAMYDANFEDPWLLEARQRCAEGCPTTAALSWTLLRRSARLSLADALRQELIVSVNICARPDFCEGVRALLVDKDRKPHWCRDYEDIDRAWIDDLFVSPWSARTHPLAELGLK
jgi:enoyl-CoA hydratase/carnithine racemase